MRKAAATASLRFVTLSLPRMFETWVLTVRRLRKSLSAIS